MKQRWNEQEMPLELREEMLALAEDGIARLGSRGDSPKATVTSIYEHVETIRPLSGEELFDEALALGCLWGEQLCAELGWGWVILVEGENEAYAVVPTDRRFSVWPTVYMHKLLASAEVDNTALLLFNMLVAGNVPPAQPNEYQLLG